MMITKVYSTIQYSKFILLLLLEITKAFPKFLRKRQNLLMDITEVWKANTTYVVRKNFLIISSFKFDIEIKNIRLFFRLSRLSVF